MSKNTIIKNLKEQIKYLNLLQSKGMLTLQGHDYQIKILKKEIELQINL